MKNSTRKIEKKGNASEVQIGGLIGISSGVEVTNSYVGNINIKVKMRLFTMMMIII